MERTYKGAISKQLHVGIGFGSVFTCWMKQFGIIFSVS